VVGEHVGLSFYTLGQRKGIGVGGTRDGSGEPWFVARKDMAGNTLWIVQGHDHPWLLATELVAEDASWIGGDAPTAGARLTAKTRYRQADAPCTVAGIDGRRFTLRFDVPQWAATPGQSAVLYDGEVCLGGGVIDRVAVPQPGAMPIAGNGVSASAAG
jgi:tRNA-specific 2-thiouridylase